MKLNLVPDSAKMACVISQNRKQYKDAVQLDLFIPYEYGHDFKVIVTNKSVCAKKALSFHHGRGGQEDVLAELKLQTQMDYISTHKKADNQVYLLSAVLARNLNREMQMLCHEKSRNTTEKRAPLWCSEQLGSECRTLNQRADRLA